MIDMYTICDTYVQIRLKIKAIFNCMYKLVVLIFSSILNVLNHAIYIFVKFIEEVLNLPFIYPIGQ